MMRRLLSFTLALSLGISLGACGGKQAAPPSTVSQEASEPSAPAASEAAQPKREADFPKKNISIIVPFAAGGGADICVRTIAKYAEEPLGQKIIINNVTGGSGSIGRTQLTQAKPDGYTLCYFGAQNSNDDLLFEGIQYGRDSFAPVAIIGTDTHVLIASKKSGVTTMEQLIDACKAKPGEVSFGIGGSWTSHDFLKIKLERQADVKMKRMVFQGGAAAVNSVASGDCDVAAPFVAEALAQIDAGNVVPVGLTYGERLKAAPEIPTLKENGFDFTHEAWRGLVAPVGTPKEVVEALREAFETAYRKPDYQAEAEKAGMIVSFMGDGFDEYYLENHEEFKALIESADLSE